jgi:hypothetical protein
MLRHYVFLKYRDGTSDDHVTAFCERLLALRATIGEIEHLEIGRDELHDARSWDAAAIRIVVDGLESIASARPFLPLSNDGLNASSFLLA